MVVRNKLYRVIDKYRKYLENKSKNITSKITSNNKYKILDFYIKYSKWPKRSSDSRKEVKLAQKFENYISKESKSYDSKLRTIVLFTGRVTNNKRKHDIEGFKEEILNFMNKHGRAPYDKYGEELIEGEASLAHKMHYYVKDKNDTSFLGKIYELDRCYRSGIARKYRPIINASLDTEKPLIRLIK